jgi:hypothetical protein
MSGTLSSWILLAWSDGIFAKRANCSQSSDRASKLEALLFRLMAGISFTFG